MTGVSSAPVVPVVPIIVSRDDARQAAAAELAKPVYTQARLGLVQRALRWVGDKIDQFLQHALGSSGTVGGAAQWWAFAVLVGLLIAGLALIRWKFGPVRRTAKADKVLFDQAAVLDAAGYRKAAEGFAAAGLWAEAVRARLRAIIASLEERTILEPRPGRTADVAAREAGRALPGQARALTEAARIFDDVWYGEAVARAEDYQRLAIIDAALSAARPVHDGVGADIPAAGAA